MGNILTKLWRGEYSLAKAYWVFGGIVTSLVFLPLELLSRSLQNVFFAYVVFVVNLIYQFVQSVGTWRSADHSRSWAGWRAWARFNTMVWFVFTCSRLVVLILAGDYAARRLQILPWI